MCRKCEACREEWRRLWTGRLMAEHATSVEVWFSTLTYGGGADNADAFVIAKRHIADLNKLLRRRGHVLKTFAVGEYGAKRGRAHFHVIFFWKSDPPQAVFDQDKVHWEYVDARGRAKRWWPHGFVKHERPRSTNGAMAYVLKYLDKQRGQRGEFLYSKRPMIGETYLLQRARWLASKGKSLFPGGRPTFQVRGNLKDKGPTAGRPYDYWIDTESALYERMIRAYVMAWAEFQPDRAMPECRHVRGWAEGWNSIARRDSEVQAGLTQLAVSSASIFGGKGVTASKLEVHCVEWDHEATLVRDTLSGAMELRWYDEEGAVEWREVVGGSLEEVLRKRPDGVEPYRQRRGECHGKDVMMR